MSPLPLRKLKTVILLFLWILVTTAFVRADDKQPVISSPADQKILNEFKSKADAYCAKNLNRFGLDELQRYDKAQDSLFAKEKTDTLATLQANYISAFNKRKTETGDLKAQFDELNQTKEIYSDKYHRLLRKAGIAFVIWLVVVLLILRWRKSLVKKSEVALEANQAQLKTSEEYFTGGEELFNVVSEWKKKTEGMIPAAQEIQKSVSALNEKLGAEATKNDAFIAIKKNSIAIQTDTNRLDNFGNILTEQQAEHGQEKVLTNINQLCDRYADLVYSGTMTDEGTSAFQFTKDFEKNLPSIKIIPEAVGTLLLNVLDNAFSSVGMKHRKAIKGYAPKVSISTRILPRFVQIRIKDNGDGVPEGALEEMYEPFFSTQPTGEGAGLGLFFSDKIIKENNGEIKIESEKGNGTDVYIKFFLQPSMK